MNDQRTDLSTKWINPAQYPPPVPARVDPGNCRPTCAIDLKPGDVFAFADDIMTLVDSRIVGEVTGDKEWLQIITRDGGGMDWEDYVSPVRIFTVITV